MKGETGVLDINPETAGVVKRIYEEYVSGASPRAIAAGLNADNIPLALRPLLARSIGRRI